MRKTWKTVVHLCVASLILSAGCRRSSPDRSLEPDRSRESEGVLIDSLVPVQPTGQTQSLFESLKPTEIGIDFAHQWNPKDRYQAKLLKTGFTGGGVCLGDYDNDGRTDVLLTQPHGGTRLYHNEGGFRFRDTTQRAGVSCLDAWTTGAMFVDVNQDGLQDIAICAYDHANYLFLNQGDGRFINNAHPAGLDFNGASVKLTFADYDGDGDLDAFLVTNRLEPKKAFTARYLGTQGSYTVAPGYEELVGIINLPDGQQKFTKAGQADHLYQNQFAETGQLQFKDVSDRAGIQGFDHGLDATWWDYNRDGHPDLYVANDFTDPDRFYHNNGDGTFEEISRRALPNTPWFAMGAAVGDLNNDGRFDMLVTDMSGTSHYRQKMAMGSMDAVAWFLDTAEPRQYMRNSLYLNSGTPRFFEAAQMAGLASSDWTWSVKIADLDNDGWEDVYTTNGFTRDYLNSDFNANLKKQGRQADSLAWYDAPELKEANLAFRHEPDKLHFENVAQRWGLDDKGISFGAAFGDLDGDGDLDLVVNNFSGPPSVYRNRSDANRVKILLLGSSSNSQGIGATLEMVTKQGTQWRYHNPANGYMSSDDPYIYFGLGDASTIQQLTVHWPSGRVQQIENLPVNHLLTIREPDDDVSSSRDAGDAPSTSRQVPLYRDEPLLREAQHHEMPYDDFASQPLLPNKLSQLGPGMAWSDVDQDGDYDVYLGGAAGQSGRLLLNDAGRFERHIEEPFADHAGSEDLGCVFFDADSDGDLDLYVVSGGVEAPRGDSRYADRLYLNQGLDESGKPRYRVATDRLPALTDSGGPVAAADFDHDGDLDLFVGGRLIPGEYPRGPESRLLQNHEGTFTDVTGDVAKELQHAGMVTSSVWTDVNADGWIDLMIACDYGPVRLFLNRQGKLIEHTTTAGLDTLLGWWNGITPGDFDNDGDLDYVVTNLGLNTKYHPSPDHPQFVFFGDFDGNGHTHIVEAKTGREGLLPVRGRSCSSNAMPFLKQRFETYHSFASSTLSDIYTQQRLDDAIQLQVTRADSILLENNGQGGFTPHSLPELAQIAPGFGAQAIHANQDGVLDLFIAQNFFSPQRETGRMNGGMGLLLLGRSDMPLNFTTVWPDKSGIIITEDAVGATALDLDGDGWQDLVAAVNDGSPRTLIRNATPGSPPLHIRLRGLPGNRDAIGSRVEVHDAAGRQSMYEVHAGSGYLTQGVPEITVALAADQRPLTIVVYWPDGTRSSHDAPRDRQPLELRHPALQ